ncbi:uncharacterized protein LOC132256169 [Phlebotomus argentipes]|uniref:uncharacterized protein LOC132256169 n=1 Tax=Phlebotomus argentipes TaxID=94469 RepID=UPI002892B691|nr:uncharacterized protein LOC132256169 [Phlebotomus argentipes]
MTKDVADIDPSDIAKHPDAIKKALEEVGSLDVLVCGTCHAAFHYVEAFTEHKAEKCSGESSLRECRESKPKVWAFLLWKACQMKTDEDIPANSWKLYQTWVRLDENVRESWVVAGKTIQSFVRMSQGQMQEVPVKVIKQIVDQPKAGGDSPQASATARAPIKRPIVVTGRKVDADQDGDTTTDEDPSPQRLPAVTMRQVVRKPAPRPAVTRPPGNLLNKNVPRLATRTMSESGDTEEHLIEKIMAKKFNPRRRTFEYLIKWMKFSYDENTWEPLQHLDKCSALLAAFESQLAYQKEQRAAKAAEEASKSSDGDSPSRPLRNSKAKAVQQVKQWCTDEENVATKRKNEDSDFELEDEASADDQPARKMAKSDAVSQALQRAGQSGTVRIVPVNRSAQAVQKPTVNGASAKVEKNSAEVVITSVKDKPTGVMRKPGVTQSTALAKKEAQVHVVSRGETMSSGIVRIAQGNSSQGAKVMPKLVPRVAQARPVVRPGVTVSRTVAGAPQRQQVLRQVSPQQPIVRNQTIIRRSVATPPQGRAVMSRVVKSTPSPKAAVVGRQQPEMKVVRRSKGKEDELSGEDMEASSGSQETSASVESTYTLCPTTGELKKPGQEDKKEAKKDEEEKKDADTVTAIQTEDGQLQQLIANEDGSPVLVTGEDGTIYQVAGKNAEGQTLLIAQGGDGEQQCVYVAAEDGDESLLALSGETVQAESGGQIVLKEDGGDGTVDPGQQLVISTDSDSQDGNITAELVQADMPSPGGTRRVVLMLPDGNFMMTEVKF